MSRFTCAIERPRTITSAVYRLRSNLINYYPAISGKIIPGASSTMKALGRVPRVKTLSPLATPSMAPVHELGKASTSIHTCNRRVDSLYRKSDSGPIVRLGQLQGCAAAERALTF
jgi:hypothetical protein